MAYDAHILVVDDDESIRGMLEVVLLGQGFTVDVANDAAEGMQLARLNVPDLVLCDLNMPGSNGLDLLRAFREDTELESCRFLIMTGNPNRELLNNPRELRGHAYLAKPFDLNELLQRLESIFKG